MNSWMVSAVETAESDFLFTVFSVVCFDVFSTKEVVSVFLIKLLQQLLVFIRIEIVPSRIKVMMANIAN